MNKLLPALALAVTSVPVLAQSSVTIYGRVDVGVFHQNGGTTPINAGIAPPGAAANMWQVRQGSAGRIGFRGNEDLGGGWQANFLMEHRFQPDTGVSETPFWQARSFVELGAPKTLGTVYAGREYIPAFWPALKLDPWGFDSVGTPGPKHQLANYTVPVSGIRSDNTVGYRSPEFFGFKTNIAISAGEGLRDRSEGANLEYTKGPLYVGLAYDKVTDALKVGLVGVMYDFGVIRPGVLYAESTVAGVKSKNTTLTARIPVATHQIKLGAARLDPAGANNTNTRLSAGYEHFLSKRTSLLANVGSAKQGNLTRTTLFDATIKHQF
ncbi:porin [Piscinibacter sp. HJYY11]|uniref:porin n=1 Tax=Piscinibacter sp. HJYY11 TaxID=2801333 RepID=UPI0019201CCE|nr:porin [Piscinibacter sp. HJYY11]MBL0727224.1 porin [Piscinibacter sp. HJYY11]